MKGSETIKLFSLVLKGEWWVSLFMSWSVGQSYYSTLTLVYSSVQFLMSKIGEIVGMSNFSYFFALGPRPCKIHLEINPGSVLKSRIQ